MNNKNYILDMDATTLAEKIKNKEISSVEATNTYIAHIKKINSKLNCLVENRFEKALEEAKQADEILKDSTSSKKLFGVPISMKESFDVAGMHTTGGIPHRKDSIAIAHEDSKVVSLLKEEGAIILGKTNTPILCYCQESDNKLYGRSNNPWDTQRTTGGSSGGEAALIAAGGASVGIGSDIGGSIRFPSHFNGVIGFRSGNNQVSQEGCFPLFNEPFQYRMLGIGAISKSVQDARLINEIIASSTPCKCSGDSFSIVMPIKTLEYPIDQDTYTALNNVKDYIQDTFEIIDEQPPYYKESARFWQENMSVDGGDYVSKIAFGNRPIHPFSEYLKEIMFKSSDLHRYFTWGVTCARLTKPSNKRINRLEKIYLEGDKVISEYFKDKILIMPIYHTPAPPHGIVIKEVFSLKKSFKRFMPFVSYVNSWGLPALIIPISENKDGLPIAMQITSCIGNEDAIFRIGEILENNFRAYKRCTHIKNTN